MSLSIDSKSEKLGLFTCITFAVGSMIGGGIFAMAGVVVNDTGPAAILSYIISGVTVLLSALSFAVISSRSGIDNSAYSYLSKVLSPVWEFITMWAFFISTITAVAFMLISFGEYIDFFLPSISSGLVTIIALIFLVAINLRSVLSIGKAEVFLVSFKMLILFIFVLFGIYKFNVSYLIPFFPSGVEPFVSSAAMLYSSYLGFSVVTNMSGVVKNPQKTIPRALILSIVIVIVIYIGVTVSLLMSGSKELNHAGLADAASLLMGKWGGGLVALAACVSTMSGSNSSFFGVNQLINQMGRDKFIPSFEVSNSFLLSKLNIFFSGIIIGILIYTGDMSAIISYCSVAGIWALVIINVAAFIVGRKGWKDKGFRLPLNGFIPAVAIISSLTQLPALGWRNVLVGTCMVSIGFIIYCVKIKTFNQKAMHR